MSEFNEESDELKITEQNQAEDHWVFLVEVGHGDGLIEYIIELDRDYWTRLTNRRIEPAELIRLTFEFLLDHESKELILKKFNITDVAGHFPNYENEIKRIL